MTDLAKDLDAAERAYALAPIAKNWTAVEAARAAVERETTRLAALSRIAADDEAAAAKAAREKLRDELAALAPTLSAGAFMTVLAEEREIVASCRRAIDEAHASILAKLRDYSDARDRASEINVLLGKPAAPVGEAIDPTKAMALATYGAAPVSEAHGLRALVQNVSAREMGEILGIGAFGQVAGVDAQLAARSDGVSLITAAVKDKLTGSKELSAIVDKLTAERAEANRIAQIRAEARANARKVDPQASEQAISALADVVAERARNAQPMEGN